MTEVKDNICGFILAAGFGTRLRPITDHVPKPLIRFFGVPLVDLALWRLQKFGVTANSINAHYLADKLADYLKTSPWGNGVKISFESPRILGRGGAYIPLKDWFGRRTILAYNGDVISNINIDEALDTHKRSGAIATMVVLPEPLGRDNAVFCDATGRIGAIAKSPPEGAGPWQARGFACMQILEPQFLNFLPSSGESDILDAYAQAIQQGLRVQSHVHNGFWHDLGSPRQLLQAHIDFMTVDQPSALARDTGLTATHAAQGTQLRLIASGETWVTPSGRSTFVGPSALITPLDSTDALSAPDDSRFGPNVVVESGCRFSSKQLLVDNALIFKSALIDPLADQLIDQLTDHNMTHSHVIFDQSGLINCSTD